MASCLPPWPPRWASVAPVSIPGCAASKTKGGRPWRRRLLRGQIAVSPASWDYGQVVAGGYADYAFVVTNLGGAAVSNGVVTAFGDAHSYGSLSGKSSNQSVVGIAVTQSGKGYWLASADGGVFAFGDAQTYGSLDAQQSSQPIVGIAATPDGHGYWLVSSNGKVYNFGAARNLGGTTSAAAIGV